MMRSLFSGVAGLKTHQTKMDVIGNNIANVNTVGYKSASVTFSDLMYQTTSNASGANEETGRGGVNAKQIGLGVKTGAITNSVATAGASQSTGNPFDVQIVGDSFFVVSDGTDNFFTRAGAFYVDGAGNLAMTSTGYTVMGWQVDPNDPTNIVKDTVSKLQIMSPENLTTDPEQTTQAYMSGIIDKNSSQLTSDQGYIVNLNIYDNLGYGYVAKSTIKSYYTTTETVDGKTVTKQHAYPDGIYRLEPTELMDAEGQKMLQQSAKQAAVDAGSTTGESTVTVTMGAVKGTGGVQVGCKYEEKVIDGKKTDTYTYSYDPDGEGIFLYYDNTNGKFLGWQQAPKNNPTLTTAEMENLNPETKLTLNIGGVDGFSDKTTNDETASNVEIALSTSTMYDNKGTSTFKGTAGNYEGGFAGRKMGKMSGVSISQDGKIFGTYDNGETKLLGQIAVASFANASGLEKVGESVYKATLNSGEFDGIGQDPTASGGSLSTGVLEMSNVDLSSEFTEMITTQRGFQANSRIITVSDTMLEELTNLKR